jgi:hypothetical protein
MLHCTHATNYRDNEKFFKILTSNAAMHFRHFRSRTHHKIGLHLSSNDENGRALRPFSQSNDAWSAASCAPIEG